MEKTESVHDHLALISMCQHALRNHSPRLMLPDISHGSSTRTLHSLDPELWSHNRTHNSLDEDITVCEAIRNNADTSRSLLIARKHVFNGGGPLTRSLSLDPSKRTSRSPRNIPSFFPMKQLGTLIYIDANSTGISTQVDIDINGAIEKGFFFEDNEWACYRRNYFSCICSFGLTPYYPDLTIQWADESTQQTYQVHNFAMSISALVADPREHEIELLQDIPGRNKGTANKPDMVPMAPKPRRLLDHGFREQSRWSLPLEHTFERMQFKQATANDSKLQSQQCYHQLMVELYADIGGKPGNAVYKKIAFRKSVELIVRARSPHHYKLL